jgi:hypothetical protein
VKFFEYSSIPTGMADELRDACVKDGGTWDRALAARVLYLAQVIVSIVIAPFALLALIVAPALCLCVEGKEMAGDLLKYLVVVNLLNIAAIPKSLISAFVPHSLKWEAPLAQVFNYSINCLKPQQQTVNSLKVITSLTCPAPQVPGDFQKKF